MKQFSLLCLLAELLLNFALHLGNGTLKEINMGENLSDKKAMMRLSQTSEGSLQLGNLLS
ncbi:hypothetical protein [Ktedonospora formicarum]|uniref:Uncharacterized protein n=1 Tax=Ktedonospora formicarum TaxID=2778364 RepID=A0A8J3IFV3_9CHLR|nr:hypothetical protein [Ktedonospora formicarum]GHO50409.1 hypothetical protein KSX_85720 [Ktedonospora formicarum]